MIEQEKKTPVSTPQITALTTSTPAPVPVAKASGWLTRETKLAIVVLGSFLALAAGVYAVKVGFKSKPTAEPTEVAQGQPNESVPQLPPQVTRQTGLEPTPVPEIKLPPAVVTPIVPELEPPPVVVPLNPLVKEPPKEDVSVVEPLIIDVPLPMTRKDDMSSSKKDRAVKNDLSKLDLPPILEPPPEVRNPVIRVGATEPKKEVPLKIELPGIPDPPPAIDLPMKKEPPAIDPPLILDPSMKTDVPVIDLNSKKEPAAIAPKKIDVAASGTEYDEDLHPFKKEDTYRSISKQYYNSDAYSIALQRYNRDHPGQADYVRVPPIWVLEQKYAGDIASISARSPSTAPPPSVDLTRNEQIYTVGDNGEMLADIAKKTLGSEDAWKRIWDMNAHLNPAKMIPGGTRLRLPDGARGQ